MTSLRACPCAGASASSAHRSAATRSIASPRLLGRHVVPRLAGAPCPADCGPSTRPLLTPPASLFDKNGGGSGEDAGDRVLAAIPFLLPLLDGLPYAKFIMMQYPFVARAFAPVAPLMYVYHSFPFAPTGPVRLTWAARKAVCAPRIIIDLRPIIDLRGTLAQERQEAG
ncbi:hypothetical protein TSOC_007677 [Tetrabaena socialis]|uniref:Uncharacterized protein n=1 Tax=Tetrabaena socialis TaxID=47790 RepID=A0A2J8A0H3_9CHLO|nr:hypothetical protein TSOC_007677 [Tetrabaena socialis]|eukprot:PNH06022.1 hypothetical protein TSOC_007677 [Tetrabaena socialis]